MWSTSPYCTDDPSHPIVIKINEVGDINDINEVTKRIKYGVDQLIDAGSAAS
jgi:hypothetical protein